MKNAAIVLRLGLTLALLAAGAATWGRFAAAHTVRPARDDGGSRLLALERALELDGKNASYHFRLGLLYRDVAEIRDLERARVHLEEAVRLNPRSWRHRRELGHLYESLGRMDDAEASFLEALRRNPRDGSYQWHLANFYLRRGRSQDALVRMAAAVDARPELLQPALAILGRFGEDLTWPADARGLLFRTWEGRQR